LTPQPEQVFICATQVGLSALNSLVCDTVPLQAFVQFYEVPAAQAAKEAMHGRIFAGIQVHATFITAQAYAVAVTAMDSEL
jgi:hypothetical protein